MMHLQQVTRKHVSPDASSRHSDMASRLSIGRNLNRSMSGSSSTHSLSVDAHEEDRNRLCDAVLAAHFSAASQGVRLDGLEEKAAKADMQMTEVKVELAEAEAQEAVQCVKWRELYMAEKSEVRSHREMAEYAEVRLQSSAMVAAEASAAHLQVECLRTEVVERGAHWAAEREQLLGEIYELQAAVAERDGRAAGFELQVQRAAAQSAQVTVDRCNEMEALAHARAEAGRASSRAQASEAARALADEKRVRATAVVEATEAELQTLRQHEEEAITQARAEVQSEVQAVAKARAELAEAKQGSGEEKEAFDRIRALEEDRRRDTEAASRMHADARQALEHLFSFVEKREQSMEEGVASSVRADAAVLHDIEARFLSQNKAAAAAEATAAAEAQSEAVAAASARRNCDALRAELNSQRQSQKDLHNELQALSSAAAAVRAVAAAKDETITELQATSRFMATEMAMNAAHPMKPTRKASDSNFSANDWSRQSVANTDRTAASTPFDAMSMASTVAGSTQGNAGQAAKIESIATSQSTIAAWPLLHTEGGALPSDSMITVASPIKAGDTASSGPAASSPSHEDTSPNPPLSQAAAFLNAAAARAAAAASAVEAFMPLLPHTSSLPQAAATLSAVETTSTPSAAGSDAASKTTAMLVDTASVSQAASEASVPLPAQGSAPAPTPSWEEAQAVMTDQIRKDISLLRKALTDSGMGNQQLEDEVQNLLRATEASAGVAMQQDGAGSATRGGSTRFVQLSPQVAVRSVSPYPSKRGLAAPTLPCRHAQQKPGLPGAAGNVDPSRQLSITADPFQRSRSDSRPKTPPRGASNSRNNSALQQRAQLPASQKLVKPTQVNAKLQGATMPTPVSSAGPAGQIAAAAQSGAASERYRGVSTIIHTRSPQQPVSRDILPQTLQETIGRSPPTAQAPQLQTQSPGRPPVPSRSPDGRSAAMPKSSALAPREDSRALVSREDSRAIAPREDSRALASREDSRGSGGMSMVPPPISVATTKNAQRKSSPANSIAARPTSPPAINPVKLSPGLAVGQTAAATPAMSTHAQVT